MNFMVRPSKSFLFDYLESRLKKIKGKVGLDAGSANFKNRRMFKTKKYFGLDINLDSLKNGIKKYNDYPNTYGIHADLSDLAQLPSNSVDIVVSTNTLYALPEEQKIRAVKHLCRLTAPTGQLICEFTISRDLNKIKNMLNESFKEVKIIYYKNIFSQAYEWIFERHGYLGSHPIAGLRPFRLLAWLISRLEFITSIFPAINQQVIFVCNGKKGSQYKKDFNLSHLFKVKDKLFNAYKI
ncbi:MAG: class I SAM-dependent methyltransferase [Candidatus Kuenenbacteria bacterium]